MHTLFFYSYIDLLPEPDRISDSEQVLGGAFGGHEALYDPRDVDGGAFFEQDANVGEKMGMRVDRMIAVLVKKLKGAWSL